MKPSLFMLVTNFMNFTKPAKDTLNFFSPVRLTHMDISSFTTAMKLMGAEQKKEKKQPTGGEIS